jgi:hypothetical protein
MFTDVIFNGPECPAIPMRLAKWAWLFRKKILRDTHGEHSHLKCNMTNRISWKQLLPINSGFFEKRLPPSFTLW